MESLKYLISADVDELSFKLECATQNLSAVHEAMGRKDFDIEFYTQAIFASYCLFDTLVEELCQMVEAASAQVVHTQEEQTA